MGRCVDCVWITHGAVPHAIGCALSGLLRAAAATSSPNGATTIAGGVAPGKRGHPGNGGTRETGTSPKKYGHRPRKNEA